VLPDAGGGDVRVLIVGAGIAGPTLAYWLLRLGHEPTLVERAPELRRGGYLAPWGPEGP
jgi:2-polyprenyl-6-methoxyphenol hydroxylase-like FAD-dependent oxidoreductase